jgi:hypothetical protein
MFYFSLSDIVKVMFHVTVRFGLEAAAGSHQINHGKGSVNIGCSWCDEQTI